MASPFTVTNTQGVDLNSITIAADVGSASGAEDAPQLGTQVFGSDGRLYVYGQSGGVIGAATAVCTVSPTTFIVTATGGSYRSPNISMGTGDRGWFSKASV